MLIFIGVVLHISLLMGFAYVIKNFAFSIVLPDIIWVFIVVIWHFTFLTTSSWWLVSFDIFDTAINLAGLFDYKRFLFFYLCIYFLLQNLALFVFLLSFVRPKDNLG